MWKVGVDIHSFKKCYPIHLLLFQEKNRFPHLIGLVVGDQLINRSSFGDLQENGLGLLPALCHSRAHVAEVAGAGALALAAAIHPDACRHALGARVQEAGDVSRVGQRPGLLVALFWFFRRWVTWIEERKGENFITFLTQDQEEIYS